MKTKRQIKREARRLFQLCMVNGSLDEGRVRRVVQAVLRSNRRGGYSLIADFLRRVKFERSRHSADVESAAALPAELQTNIAANLDRVYGPGISVAFSENPALIGGIRIRVASDVYDGSVRAGLAELEKRF